MSNFTQGYSPELSEPVGLGGGTLVTLSYLGGILSLLSDQNIIYYYYKIFRPFYGPVPSFFLKFFNLEKISCCDDFYYSLNLIFLKFEIDYIFKVSNKEKYQIQHENGKNKVYQIFISFINTFFDSKKRLLNLNIYPEILQSAHFQNLN